MKDKKQSEQIYAEYIQVAIDQIDDVMAGIKSAQETFIIHISVAGRIQKDLEKSYSEQRRTACF